MRFRTKGLRTLLLIGLLAVTGCKSPNRSSKAIAGEMVSAVPLTSSPTQVIALLDSRKIEHSPYLRNTTKGNLIFALIPEKAPILSIVKESESVVFRFDEHDKLTAYDMRAVYIGP